MHNYQSRKERRQPAPCKYFGKEVLEFHKLCRDCGWKPEKPVVSQRKEGNILFQTCDAWTEFPFRGKRMKTAVVSDILQFLEQFNEKEPMPASFQRRIAKPESGQRNMEWSHSRRREEAFAQTSFTKRFSTVTSTSAKTLPPKPRNSETLWPCSTKRAREPKNYQNDLLEVARHEGEMKGWRFIR